MKPILYIQPIDTEAKGMQSVPSAKNLISKKVYELKHLDLNNYSAILIPAHVDQRALLNSTQQLDNFLNNDGLVVFNGHVAYPILQEFKDFIPVPKTTVEYLEVQRVQSHPIFEGVDTQDLSYRKGVAGFYGRGHNPPPTGAQIIHTLSGTDAPLDWIYKRPSGGTILMHAGNSMWMHFNDDTSASRITPQLFQWIEQYQSAKENKL
jgi:hypothetical protein